MYTSTSSYYGGTKFDRKWSLVSAPDSALRRSLRGYLPSQIFRVNVCRDFSMMSSRRWLQTGGLGWILAGSLLLFWCNEEMGGESLEGRRDDVLAETLEALREPAHSSQVFVSGQAGRTGLSGEEAVGAAVHHSIVVNAVPAVDESSVAAGSAVPALSEPLLLPASFQDVLSDNFTTNHSLGNGTETTAPSPAAAQAEKKGEPCQPGNMSCTNNESESKAVKGVVEAEDISTSCLQHDGLEAHTCPVRGVNALLRSTQNLAHQHGVQMQIANGCLSFTCVSESRKWLHAKEERDSGPRITTVAQYDIATAWAAVEAALWWGLGWGSEDFDQIWARLSPVDLGKKIRWNWRNVAGMQDRYRTGTVQGCMYPYLSCEHALSAAKRSCVSTMHWTSHIVNFTCSGGVIEEKVDPLSRNRGFPTTPYHS